MPRAWAANELHIVRLEDGLNPQVRRGSQPDLAEERRLLFVAVTGATDEVILSRSDVNGWGYHSNPSRFLGEMPLDPFVEHSSS